MAARGVTVVEGVCADNPACVHGPTVLFERFLSDGGTRRFYACAACRDRKDCAFFLWADHAMPHTKRQLWGRLRREHSHTRRPHTQRYKEFECVRSACAAERVYCHSCAVLMLQSASNAHTAPSCRLTTPITDAHLAHPSTFLPAKENAKLEAQYLFSARSVEVLVGLVRCVKGASGVLCVGAPRIHEAITSSTSTSTSTSTSSTSTPSLASLLLDIDDRYCSFFPPESFLHYNMFNHHFFDGRAALTTYRAFLAAHHKLVLVSDPPFGGRMELLAHTLATIERDWRVARGEPDSRAALPVLFVFPYFLEAQVLASLPSLAMLDYQVDYDNHPIYSRGPKGMKHGSAVRVFSNQPLDTLPLPEEEGYRWCDPCRRWVHPANNHCDLCQACTSKDGRTYKHCGACGRCVKPAWIHCPACDACRPADHTCCTAAAAAAALGCFTCGDADHKHSACPKRKRSSSSSRHHKNKKKKANNNNNNKKDAIPNSLADERQRNLDVLSRLLEG